MPAAFRHRGRCSDPARFCDVVAALEPTFGAINLEYIKAPECFAIDAELCSGMRIPVFHDDQHGAAITVAFAGLCADTMRRPVIVARNALGGSLQLGC